MPIKMKKTEPPVLSAKAQLSNTQQYYRNTNEKATKTTKLFSRSKED
jgi:hypothetical protein